MMEPFCACFKEKTNSESEESSEENDKEKKTLPGKLQTKFDQVVREQEGKQRRMVERRPKRLATSFTNFDVLEKERRSRERAKDLEKSQMLLQQETNSIKAAKATFKECITQVKRTCKYQIVSGLFVIDNHITFKHIAFNVQKHELMYFRVQENVQQIILLLNMMKMKLCPERKNTPK